MSGKKHFLDSADALYLCFRTLKLSTREVAVELNINESTLHKYIMGHVACPVGVFRDIYSYAVRHKYDSEASILRSVLIPEGQDLVNVNPDLVITLKTVEAELIEDMQKLSDLSRIYEAAIDDGEITFHEHQQLKFAIEEAIAAVKRTEAKIDQEIEKLMANKKKA